MESVLLFNLIMALVIALVIIAIATVKNPVLKAVVYGLPIPITVALVASQKGVDSSHIVGLFLLVLFLWVVHWLRRCGVHILIADVIGALIYVVLGFMAVHVMKGAHLFIPLVGAYVVFWILWMMRTRGPPQDEPAPQVNTVPLLRKGVVIFVVANVLLALKDLLKGVVVTFPFSGVFAVVEMQGKLHTLASEFTKNSIAILVFFAIVHYAAYAMQLYAAVALGWVGYVVVLTAVRKYLI
jgi:hypothetical protein